jgi:hypothetical protein
MAEYHRRFYAERASLLEQEREYWLSLNVLYEGVGEAMRGFTDDERYYILSTKQSAFIAEILASKGIRWPIDRIIDSGKEKKTDIILSVLDSAGYIVGSLSMIKSITSLGLLRIESPATLPPGAM